MRNAGGDRPAIILEDGGPPLLQLCENKKNCRSIPCTVWLLLYREKKAKVSELKKKNVVGVL